MDASTYLEEWDHTATTKDVGPTEAVGGGRSVGGSWSVVDGRWFVGRWWLACRSVVVCRWWSVGRSVGRWCSLRRLVVEFQQYAKSMGTTMQC